MDIGTVKVLCLIAFAGHIICGITDFMMSYSKGRRFSFADIKDPARMDEAFSHMPLKQLELSMLLGAVSLFMAGLGYAAISSWACGYSSVWGLVGFISAMFFIVLITAHHILCAAPLWFYVKLQRTDEALEAATEFFNRTVIASIAYIGLIAFDIILLVMIALGKTGLPKISCLVNSLPVFVLLAPTKLPAKGNIANSIMFIGLFILLSIYC